MANKTAGARMRQAQKRGFGAQEKLKFSYQVVGEEMKRVVLEVYYPVAKGRGNAKKVQDLRTEANDVIREMLLAFVECFKDVEGIVRFRYDIGDE